MLKGRIRWFIFLSIVFVGVLSFELGVHWYTVLLLIGILAGSIYFSWFSIAGSLCMLGIDWLSLLVYMFSRITYGT